MIKIKDLAWKIVNESLKIKEKDRILITVNTLKAQELVLNLISELTKKKAFVSIKISDDHLNEALLNTLDDYYIEETKKHKAFEVDNYDIFITIEYNHNDYSDLDREKVKLLNKALSKINDLRINQRKWLILIYPSPLDAYKAKMSFTKFQEFYLKVMNYDYDRMKKAIIPLKELMEKTDRVHLKSLKTDLTFSIKDMPVIPCLGEYNLPDGEIFTAPLKESVNGYITYNTPSTYQGNVYYNVKLEFKDGKIIKVTADNDVSNLEKIFNSDAGSRYIGEFSLGLNPLILDPMGNILFDEKISGSIHLTPGSSYKEAYNGNDSVIHWDLVLIERKEYGGGELYFDDILIRKDGKFILEELKPLNFL